MECNYHLHKCAIIFVSALKKLKDFFNSLIMPLGTKEKRMKKGVKGNK